MEWTTSSTKGRGGDGVVDEGGAKTKGEEEEAEEVWRNKWETIRRKRNIRKEYTVSKRRKLVEIFCPRVSRQKK